MSQLEKLTLYRTRISNAGLAQLATLKNLKDLDVRYTRVTATRREGSSGEASRRDGAVPGFVEPHDEARGRDGAPSRAKARPPIGKWLSAIGATRAACATATPWRSCSPPRRLHDRELALLQELPHLEELSLRDTEVSALGLAHLSKLARAEDARSQLDVAVRFGARPSEAAHGAAEPGSRSHARRRIGAGGAGRDDHSFASWISAARP